MMCGYALTGGNRFRSDGAAGFTLLETLVALTILSLSVAVLFGLFSQALQWSRDDSRAMQARVLAQSLLARAETSPPGSDEHGMEASGLWWGLHVSPNGKSDARQTGLQAETVTATVHWAAGGSEKELALSTLVLAPPGAEP